MKNKQTIFIPAITVVFALLMSFTFPKNKLNSSPNAGDKFEIPADIQEIFDKSCFGCHNVDTQNDKGKKKLMIDKLADLSKSKLIGKLDGIAETVKEKEMPPEKFLEKYPDNKLTADEAEKLVNWAENAAEELMK